MKKLTSVILLIFIFTVLISSQASAGEYLNQVGTKYLRGIKNVTSSFVEIPKGTIEEGTGRPVIKQTKGFFIGLGKMLLRTGSGALDLVIAPVPDYNGLPVEPETLF